MKTLDLFCGVGGLSIGFQKAGFDLVGAVDKWDSAVNLYNLNNHIFGHKAITFDLTEFKNLDFDNEFGNIECVIGGPPCQDFSSAGKRVESDNADLTVVFAKIIEQIRPSFFVMENVTRTQKSFSFIKAKKIFVNSGYGLTEVVLDASLCGVPQKRKRFFCIGELNGTENFLIGHLKKDIASEPLSLRKFFGSDRLNLEHYYRHPRSYNRRAIFSVNEPSPTIRGVNRPMPSTYKFHPGDTTKNLSKVRSLTSSERSEIQTFPTDYKWEGTKTQIEQFIGNAVPPKLSEFVAVALKNYIEFGSYGQLELLVN